MKLSFNLWSLKLLAAFATGCLCEAALACTYEFAPEPIGGPSARFLAPKMASEATFGGPRGCGRRK